MEAHRALLQQELESVHQEIAAAQREVESATSVQRLFEKADYFADCLRKFEQPALPHHEGTLVLWHHCAQIVDLADQQRQHHKVVLHSSKTQLCHCPNLNDQWTSLRQAMTFR